MSLGVVASESKESTEVDRVEAEKAAVWTDPLTGLEYDVVQVPVGESICPYCGFAQSGECPKEPGDPEKYACEKYGSRVRFELKGLGVLPEGVSAVVGATGVIADDVSEGLLKRAERTIGPHERASFGVIGFEPEKVAVYGLIALGLIDPSPYQTGDGRGDPERDAEIGELAESVRASGLAEPLVVRAAAGGRYELIAGHRRLAACRMAGLESAACVVREVTDSQAEELHVIENLQRKDLTAIEEARSVARMLEGGRSPEEVARVTGKSVRWVYRRAAITRLTAGWTAAAGRYGLSAAYLERVGRLPGAVQDEVLHSMTCGVTEDYFARGGDAGVLEEEIEISLRRLSGAPWAHIPGDPAKCAGCLKRSDAQPELFGDMEDEPRCMDRACWDKKIDSYVAAALKQAKAAHGEVIAAEANSAHLYKERADARYSVPVVITDGASRGRVMWAPNKDAAKEIMGGEKAKKGLTAKDRERAAYAEAVRLCIDGAVLPDWGDGKPAVPVDALVAFALGCGVSPYAVVSGAFSGPLQRSLAILDKLAKGADEFVALWQAARPNILKALDFDKDGVSAATCEAFEAVARNVQAALAIPDDMVEAFYAELAPKKAKGRGKAKGGAE